MIQANRSMWSHLKTQSITVSVKPVISVSLYSVFQVKNIIDKGNGRAQMMLSQAFPAELFNMYEDEEEANRLAIPGRIANVDFIYMGEAFAFSNLPEALRTLSRSKKKAMAKICPEVLMAGDFVVFKQNGSSGSVKEVQAYRMLSNKLMQNKKAEHAL